MRDATSIRAKLRAFVTTRIEYAEANRDFFRIYHSEFGNLTSATTDSEFQKLYLQQARALEDILQTAIRNAEIPPVRADFAAFLVYDMVKSVMTQRLREWSTARMEDDIEMLNDLIWKGLGA